MAEVDYQLAAWSPGGVAQRGTTKRNDRGTGLWIWS
jgi:hypothetical protein